MNTTACFVQHAQHSGSVELYFYGELPEAERRAVAQHLAGCAACRRSLEDLALIRSALSARPDVAAPPSGDWSAFMARLDRVVAAERAGQGPAAVPASRRRWPLAQVVAMAALLALVTLSVFFAARPRSVGLEPSLSTTSPSTMSATSPIDAGRPVDGPAAGGDGLAAVGQQHMERSKLVLLGLASKDAARTPSDEWQYERELASRLLADTRLYRLAAEEQGLNTMASVMRDLELVLLQTSMTEGNDASGLSQIQRAISKRDLLQKMDVVRTAGS